MTTNKTDYKDIDDIIESQNAKMQDLSLALSIVQDKKNLGDSLTRAFHLVSQIKNNIAILQKGSDKFRETLSKVDECENVCHKLEDRMSYIENNLPNQFNKMNLMNSLIESELNYSNLAPETPLISKRLDFDNNESIIESIKKHNGPMRLAPKNPTQHLEVKYLTIDEFQSIPPYMLGRVSFQTLNTFIDKINACVKDKYDFMRDANQKKKNKIPLKRGASDRLTSYVRQETNETMGKKFITQDDLKSILGGKIDKHSLNLLTMLRHTKRLRELRIQGVVKYIMNFDFVQ